MVKDADLLKRTSENGQYSAIFADARYTFPIIARCPRCGAEAFVTRYDSWGSSMNRAIFKCSSCFHQFEPAAGNISFA